MTSINPFVGSILQSTTVQRTQAAEKNGHVQRAQTRAKDSASTGEQLEHQVESSDGLAGVRDEDPRHSQQQQHKPKRPPKDGESPASDETREGPPVHIDLKV